MTLNLFYKRKYSVAQTGKVPGDRQRVQGRARGDREEVLPPQERGLEEEGGDHLRRGRGEAGAWPVVRRVLTCFVACLAVG